MSDHDAAMKCDDDELNTPSAIPELPSIPGTLQKTKSFATPALSSPLRESSISSQIPILNLENTPEATPTAATAAQGSSKNSHWSIYQAQCYCMTS